MMAEIKWLKGVGLGLILGLVAYSHAATFYQETQERHSESGLMLVNITLNDVVLTVELASTDQEKAYGLMNRYILPQNKGMLFLFDSEAPRNFWMKNTKIPLDILYFDATGALVDFVTADPCRADPCPGYPSKQPAQYVLELGKGERARLNIALGAKLKGFD